jgi:hypothetical protein
MAEDRIITWLQDLPVSFDHLLEESGASGYRFLRRVAHEWQAVEMISWGHGKNLLYSRLRP